MGVIWGGIIWGGLVSGDGVRGGPGFGSRAPLACVATGVRCDCRTGARAITTARLCPHPGSLSRRCRRAGPTPSSSLRTSRSVRFGVCVCVRVCVCCACVCVCVGGGTAGRVARGRCIAKGRGWRAARGGMQRAASLSRGTQMLTKPRPPPAAPKPRPEHALPLLQRYRDHHLIFNVRGRGRGAWADVGPACMSLEQADAGMHS